MNRFTRLTALPVAAFLTIAVVAGPAAAASDAQIAKAGMIVASDVPSTWQSSPPDSSDDKELEELAAKIPGCKKYLAARKSNDRAARAESRDFSTGVEDLSNTVWVFASEKSAKKSFAAMTDSTIDDCLTELFKQALDEQTSSEPTVRGVRVAIVQTDDLPAIGDDVIGYTGGAEFSMSNGTTQRLLLGNFTTRVGRSIITYALSGPAGPNGFSTSYNAAIDAAIGSTVERMEDALS
jgi:hypothetical protein